MLLDDMHLQLQHELTEATERFRQEKQRQENELQSEKSNYEASINDAERDKSRIQNECASLQQRNDAFQAILKKVICIALALKHCFLNVYI